MLNSRGMLNKGKGDVKMKGDAKGMVKGRGMKGRGMKGRGMKGRGMVKGRGTLQGGEPRCCSWVVLHPCRHLCTCCHRLAACRHHVSWSCHRGAASSSSVVVPCHRHPCPGCVVIVPCCQSVIVLCVSKVGWDELRGVLTMVP